MAAYRRVDDLRSPAGWLPVHRDQLRAQRSVSSMGSLYLYLFTVSTVRGHGQCVPSYTRVINAARGHGCHFWHPCPRPMDTGI